jgi:long-chain acyl-CoA synthetase
VRKGDRVAIGMRNYPEWITSFAAITSIGAISVSLNAWWTEDELDYALGDSAPKVLIADKERVERGLRSCQERGIAILGVRLGDAAPEGVDRLEDVLVPGATMPDVDVREDDDATILYTSARPGTPRARCRRTGRCSTRSPASAAARSPRPSVVVTPAASSVATRPTRCPPVFILTVPLFHVTGCVSVMLSTFANGLKLVIMYRWNPERAPRAHRAGEGHELRGRAHHVVGPPRVARLRQARHLEPALGGRRRRTGAAELVRRIDAGFAKARPGIGYGMTETNAYGPQNSGDDYVSHPTSTGRSTPILEVKIVDEEGNEVPIGERGEICFKGPNLIRGYWNNPRPRRDDRRRLAAHR